MNGLLEKFYDFKTLNNYSFKYLLEDGSSIVFVVSQYQFAHLIGLQKLVDIPIIAQFNDENNKVVQSKYINSLIKREALLTEDTLKESSHFQEIEERYNFLSRENILSLSFNEAIIDFDPNSAHSKLKSTYLLVESKNNGILHLGLKKEGSTFVPETFFFRNDDMYIRGQQIVRIRRIEIFDHNNKLILEEDLYI